MESRLCERLVLAAYRLEKAPVPTKQQLKDLDSNVQCFQKELVVDCRQPNSDVYVLGREIQIDQNGKPDQVYIFEESFLERIDTSIAISTLSATSKPIEEMTSAMKDLLGENFISAMLVLGGMAMAMHFELIVKHGMACPMLFAVGPTKCGKTTALQCAATMVGEKIWGSGTSKFFGSCGNGTSPWKYDDKILEEIVMDTYNQIFLLRALRVIEIVLFGGYIAFFLRRFAATCTSSQLKILVKEYFTTGRHTIIVDPDPNLAYTKRKLSKQAAGSSGSSGDSNSPEKDVSSIKLWRERKKHFGLEKISDSNFAEILLHRCKDAEVEESFISRSNSELDIEEEISASSGDAAQQANIMYTPIRTEVEARHISLEKFQPEQSDSFVNVTSVSKLSQVSGVPEVSLMNVPRLPRS
ncbi:hypothetical protein ACROYT_G014153 [Oculina patagonica]